MLRLFPLHRLEAAIDRAVRDSGRARELCGQLDGRRLRIAATGNPWTAGLHVTDGTVRLELRDGHAAEGGSATTGSLPADATLRGSAVSLLGAMGDGQRALLQNGALRIDGDAEVAQRFAELLHCLRPDVESELARMTGPVPAHLLSSGVRALWQRGRQLWETRSRNAADWLAHERRTLVSAPEAEHRYRGIESARERLDRLEARLQQLERRP